MSKRKPSIVIEDVLPDDDRLGQRGKIWKSFMDKYARKKEVNDISFDNACNLLDYVPSDPSDASDVETDAECDDESFPLENREELDNQLRQVVAVRKQNWAENGLLKLMESIEDPGQNMLSHEKVEKWLFGQKGGGTFDMTQANETVLTERSADGDRMKYHRKQQLTVSRTADDADSLYSVDTAKYILQNKKDRSTTSKIKVTTMIKRYTISTNNSNTLAIRPSLHSISSFPIIEEDASASRLQKTSKSDSAFETSEEQKQNRSNELNVSPYHTRSAKSPVVTQSAKPNKRKKMFKKTLKKSTHKSPASKRNPIEPEKFEEALKSCINVKKIPTLKNRRIQWQEVSHVAESSSEESDGVFTGTTRSKAKSHQYKLRKKSSNDSESSKTPESSPRKKVISPRRSSPSPRKAVDRELLVPFEAICLSPSKRNKKSQTCEQQQLNKTVDQTTNLTALFSRSNDTITNSTEIDSTVSSKQSGKSVSKASTSRTLYGYPDLSRGIVVYQPKLIQPNLGPNESVRITYADLKLDQVTKPRHLEKFKKFNYLIHPNSSVKFIPSDSEDDERSLAQTTMNVHSSGDEEESFDEDDPILTFNPRKTDRLNVMECPYNTTQANV